jgi:SsrA-binding protein
MLPNPTSWNCGAKQKQHEANNAPKSSGKAALKELESLLEREHRSTTRGEPGKQNMGKSAENEPAFRVVATNRKARHEYHIEDRWEAGIILRGTEVKSLRNGGGSIVDSYAEPDGGEIWINNLHIQHYEQGNRFNVETKRRRKLLLNKREIKKINGLATQKGYTLVPLRVYFKGQYVKVEIGLGRGKKDYDKRQDIRERDYQREMDRSFKHR